MNGVVVRVAGLEEAERWWPLLDEGEKRRASTIARPGMRDRFVVSRGLRRHVLAACIGCGTDALRFDEEDGKPRLIDGGGWDFNQTHSGAHVAVAVSRKPVGIDLEVMRPVREQEAIVRRYFHPDEVEAWLGLAPGERREAFFVLWSAREAALKCAGLGLARGLGVTRVDPGILRHRRGEVLVDGVVMRLQRLDAPADCVLCVARG